ncbi:MAG: D-alanine--D-alanine ligase [Cryomorphaceae bacterium]|jgi:D-alanine-D-alanine ligase|nr:D-alanine--D-alanine ligase [Cryomorphaceae bacterium]
MKHIGIICGGYSSEYDISLKSASTILSNLPEPYTGHQIVISEKGWIVQNGYNPGIFDLNQGKITFRDGKGVQLDGAIVYVHGNPGENGKIQAVLDLLSIPYVNANVLASALSFDKWFCNQFLSSFDIPVAQSILLHAGDPIGEHAIVQTLGLPLFVKPTDSGSSYGISKVKEVAQLPSAIDRAFKEGKTVVLESFLDGIEVTCGVFRNAEELIALPLTEIVSENEFFDYEAKYQGKSHEITPARISDEQTRIIQAQAKRIYTLLNLKSIARIDFMLVKEIPYVIEVNTTPGFSSESIVPKMLEVAGISISSFWEAILSTELTR